MIKLTNNHKYMTKIRLFGPVKKFYPYRTARLTGWGACVALDTAELSYLRRQVEKAGYQMDNHVVFATECCNFWYSDNHLYIGGSIEEGRY